MCGLAKAHNASMRSAEQKNRAPLCSPRPAATHGEMAAERRPHDWVGVMKLGEMLLDAVGFRMDQKTGQLPWHFGLSALERFGGAGGAMLGSSGQTKGRLNVLECLVWVKVGPW
jgi:hypothetical protein